MKILTLLILIGILYGCKDHNQLNAFIKPGALWPDENGVHINAHGGGILYYDNKYYWYGEHKIAGAIGNTAQVGVGVYSSDDLFTWKNEGIALKVNETDSLNDIAKGCVLERPKVIYNARTKKFVMWFHLEFKGNVHYNTARSGVAVSDYPTGPFVFLKSFRPNAGFWPVNVQPWQLKPVPSWVEKTYFGGSGNNNVVPDSANLVGRDFKSGQMARDMNLFVDDDSTAYHIYSSEDNSTLHISKLTNDYLFYSGQYIRVFPARYIEGATLFKRNGKYYIIGSDCSGWAPNEARSATADQIFGNWHELGNPCVGNDHEFTFHSQSTFVFPVQGKSDAFIFMADRWTPDNPIDGRYVWLPVNFINDKPVLEWKDKWDMKVFAN